MVVDWHVLALEDKPPSAAACCCNMSYTSAGTLHDGPFLSEEWLDFVSQGKLRDTRPIDQALLAPAVLKPSTGISPRGVLLAPEIRVVHPARGTFFRISSKHQILVAWVCVRV